MTALNLPHPKTDKIEKQVLNVPTSSNVRLAAKVSFFVLAAATIISCSWLVSCFFMDRNISGRIDNLEEWVQTEETQKNRDDVLDGMDRKMVQYLNKIFFATYAPSQSSNCTV